MRGAHPAAGRGDADECPERQRSVGVPEHRKRRTWRFLAPRVGRLSVKENIDADLAFTRRSAFVQAW